jgi:N-acetylmuramoyl-L-alanine amidase
MREIVAAVLVCLVAGTAAAQSPQSVDDVIDKVLRGATRSDTRPAAPQAREALVMGVRMGAHQDRTRFVVEMSEPVAMRTFTLTNPNRVVIDMPLVKWHLEGPPRGGFGAVRSYRYGTFRQGNSRFVIDLGEPVAVGEPMVLEPSNGSGYRVVFDLFPTTQAKFDRQAGWPEDLRARDAAAQVAMLPKTPPPLKSRIKRVIVIDPGHGGTDPGTISADGVQEKDLTLAMGLQLQRVLLARGYTVYMTRDSDNAVELPHRRALAQSLKADLLISMHADSHPNRSIFGLSIYTLSEKGSDAEARALAKKENDADKRSGAERASDNDVASILLALSQRDTMNKSSRFANDAIESLRDQTDILPHKPHRDAAFVVLKSPVVPSVLIEMGYLSNPDEARKMQSDSWRARVARAIAAAVDRQFMTAMDASPAADRYQ